ncbi:Rsc4 protein [Saccharomycopsis crataegensis]|uniref:Rsc4 protein n=1 Tax=Saccharomycopsis crataegensis TaxID=43959 RepID=A0AAV5QS67_9ASCO|nr:Rsc4 protein [Saccharomycopsis crataegensis]
MVSKRRSSRVPDQSKKLKKPKVDDELYDFFKSTMALAQELRDGPRLIKTQFMRLPSKKLYADYYERIKIPVSFQEIKEKINNNAYGDAKEFLADFELMSDNASEYNLKESLIAIDAANISNFVRDQVEQFLKEDVGESAEKKAEAKESGTRLKLKLNNSSKTKTKEAEEPVDTNFLNKSINADLRHKLQDLLEKLKNFTENDEPIADVFLEEPSRKLYPDYYTIIKKPIAINTILKGLNNKKSSKYSKVENFFADMNLMWKNAQTYNEEDSLVYHFSEVLSKHFNESLCQLANDEGLTIPGLSEKVDLPAPGHKKKGRSTKHTAGAGSSLKLKLSKSSAPMKKETKSVKDEVEDEIPEEAEEEKEPEAKKEDEEEEKQEEEEEEGEEEARVAEHEKSEDARKPRRRVKDGDYALIRMVSINSSRPKGFGNQRMHYGQTGSDSQFANTVFQNWFEYNFEAGDYKISNVALNLPVFNNISNKGALTVFATLRDDLVDKKYENFLTVNDERVKPSPSITYADSDKVLTTRYDLKLAMGLNNIRISAKVLRDNTVSGGIDSSNILTVKDMERLPEEHIDFWVNVCQ